MTEKVRRLSGDERKGVRPELLDPIEYRKSGLSLNHIIGCPLDCAYCVRHLFDNFEMKRPSLLMDDETAVEQLVSHRFFQKDITPIQLFNRATDPFLPAVKEHTLNVLRLLDQQGLKNHFLLITRFQIRREDLAPLNEVRNLKLSLLITYSGIDNNKIEPLGWETAVDSLKMAAASATRFKVILYWRPVVSGLNDSVEHIARAIDLSRVAHATAFTGLFFRPQIQAYYRSVGLDEPYTDTPRRKILPRRTEDRIIPAFREARLLGKLFRKSSCAVAYAHGVADYNGHFGVNEICDICPSEQIKICKNAFRRPTIDQVREVASRIGVSDSFEITDRAILYDGLAEQQRYFIQHALGFQVHDRKKPHHFGRHGRAEVGWEESDD